MLAQDYPDIEYIIVDGASKDQSAKIIREAIAGHEDKVKFISEPDHGMYEAINKGIRMATGDVIALCHSDDFMFAKDTVSHVVKKMEETDCDFLYADGIFVNEQNTNKVVRKWIGGKYARWMVRCGWLPLHPGGAESAFPGVVPYQQGDVGLDAGCCLWCLLSDGTACRMDYPEVGLQEGSDNRTGSLRYRCPDVHTGKQDQQFLLLRSVAVCDRMRTDLSGNECESLYYGTGTS